MTTRYPATEPKSSRNELVVALAVLSVISGAGGLFVNDLRPRTISELLPGWAAVIWCLCLLLGGLGLFFAIAVPDRITGWYYERPAMLMLGFGSVIYATALLLVGNLVAFTAGVTYATYGVACLIRLRHIHRWIKALQAPNV